MVLYIWQQTQRARDWKRENLSVMSESLLCSVVWRSSDRDGHSSGFGADLRVLPCSSFLPLCLQGALERRVGDGPAADICLSSFTSLSLLSPPFFSRPCPFRSSLSLVPLLHTTPSEELFFKMPLICTAFWELLPAVSFRWGDEGSSSEERLSCEELGPERHTSLGFRLMDSACCRSERWGVRWRRGSWTGSLWS